MHGYNFTERVRQVLAMAREEAGRLHHEYVGTEHILLGLIREGDGVGATALRNLSVDLDGLRHRVEEAVKRGDAARSVGPDLPYTSRAKKVLELAMSEARTLHHSYVGTEHLLLGLLLEEKGIAAQVLTAAGADTERVRDEVLRILGTDVGPGQRMTVTSRLREPGDATPVVIAMHLQFADGRSVRTECRSVLDAMRFLLDHGE